MCAKYYTVLLTTGSNLTHSAQNVLTFILVTPLLFVVILHLMEQTITNSVFAESALRENFYFSSKQVWNVRY